jgi:hypothetical protein
MYVRHTFSGFVVTQGLWNNAVNYRPTIQRHLLVGHQLALSASSQSSFDMLPKYMKEQGCQMVYFQTKKKSWKSLGLENIGRFYGNF